MIAPIGPKRAYSVLLLVIVLTKLSFPQDTTISDAPAPEFFGFEAGTLQRLSFQGAARRNSIGSADRFPRSGEFWWMPANAGNVFVAKSVDNRINLLQIDTMSAEVTQFDSIPAKGYKGIRGHGATIYLLRVDTADNRYRPLSDSYSLKANRIVATRTLLDLPRLPSKFPMRIVWDNQLRTIAVSLNNRLNVSLERRDLHVVNLQTGLKHQPDGTSGDISPRDMRQMVPIRFDAAGNRLILWREVGADAKPSRPLFQFNLKTEELEPIGTSTLPARAPVCISGDASLAVYTAANGYELWRVADGTMLGRVPRSRSPVFGLRNPLVKFVGNGAVLAISGGKSLRLISGFSAIPPGQTPALYEHQLHPSDKASAGSEYLPVFLAGTKDALIYFGAFTTHIPGRGPDGPWLQRVLIRFPEGAEQSPSTPDSRQNGSLKREQKELGEWTPWASGPDYQRHFREVTSNKKYPISVYGRHHNGKTEYRGQFFDQVEGLSFLSRHGIAVDEIRRQAIRIHAQGFREVWRYSFVNGDGTMRYCVIWNRVDDE